MRTANCTLRGSGERNGVQGEQWLGSVVCDDWSCCGCRKGTSRDEAKLNSGKIKPVAIASIELSFSEGISKLVSQSVSWLVSQ